MSRYHDDDGRRIRTKAEIEIDKAASGCFKRRNVVCDMEMHSRIEAIEKSMEFLAKGLEEGDTLEYWCARHGSMLEAAHRRIDKLTMDMATMAASIVRQNLELDALDSRCDSYHKRILFIEGLEKRIKTIETKQDAPKRFAIRYKNYFGLPRPWLAEPDTLSEDVSGAKRFNTVDDALLFLDAHWRDRKQCLIVRVHDDGSWEAVEAEETKRFAIRYNGLSRPWMDGYHRSKSVSDAMRFATVDDALLFIGKHDGPVRRCIIACVHDNGYDWATAWPTTAPRL